MGSNNSKQNNDDVITITRDDSRNPALSNNFDAKDQRDQLERIKRSVLQSADDIYAKIWDSGDIQIYTDRRNNVELPYISDKKAYQSENLFDPAITSEGLKYIEVIVCKGDLDELRENYAVNKNAPDHECRGNCKCIKHLFEVRDKNTEDEINTAIRNELLASITSSENDQGAKCPIHMHGGCGCAAMRGGADEITSTEDAFDDSDEQTVDMFSDTSELSDTVTDTTTDDDSIIDNKNKKKKVNNETDSDYLVDTDSDEVLDVDESDDIEDELDVDDEDLTEEGYIIQQSDISSTDLYRLQNNLFQSETDTEEFMQSRVKKNNRNNRNRYDSDDDENTTDQVRRAMAKMNERGNIFDSESREILKMRSDSDHYLKRPVNRNNKYY